MSSNEAPPPEEVAAPPFTTDSLRESATLACLGHRRGTVEATLHVGIDGRLQTPCTFVFDATPALLKDVELIRAGKARVEPGEFMRATKVVRQAMDDAIEKARAAAPQELKDFLAWQAREAERYRVANLPSPWTAKRKLEAEGTGRARVEEITRFLRAARPWRSSDNMAAPEPPAEGDEKGA